MTSNAPAQSDHADVAVRPPLLYLGSIAAGLVLHALAPMGFLPAGLSRSLGPALVALALGLFAWAVRTMLGAGEQLPTNTPTHRLVKGGPYARSRNPIYLSFSLLQLGIAVWVNSVWVLAALAVSLLVISFGVIAREERYLDGRLGDEYRAYRRRVRRWL